MKVNSFEISVSDEILLDLRRRLCEARWPDEILDSGWRYGTNLGYLKDLVNYWRTEFDWRSQEKMLNDYKHFKTNIDGLNVHFIHEKGKGSNNLPLIITHGWPSTILEMYKVIPLLTDPVAYGGDGEDAFDVVAPSLPGFGFSDSPLAGGMDVESVASLWNKLMTENLGYSRFGSHGGDIGAGVTSQLGRNHSDNLFGIHLTSVTRPNPYLGPGSRDLTNAEKIHMGQREDWQLEEGGYNHIQSTKPQTLSYGLNDSPVGLAAWILEKYRTWSDSDGNVETRFSKDELLTNITIYWVTKTIGSSVRMYYENQKNIWNPDKEEIVDTPTGVAIFPYDLATPPREWAERSYNIQRWTNMPRGGHFAAMEEPELLVEDIRNFFRSYRKI